MLFRSLVEGVKRVKIKNFAENDGRFEAAVEELADNLDAKDDVNAFMRSLMSQF